MLRKGLLCFGILLVLTLVSFHRFEAQLNYQVKTPDEARFLAYGYNLYKYKIFSPANAQAPDRLMRDTQIEPLIPYILSAIIFISNRFFEEVSYECIGTKLADGCPKTLFLAKLLNFALLVLAALIVFFVVKGWTSSFWLAALSFMLVVCNKELLHYTNRVLSEIPALFLLTAASASLLRWSKAWSETRYAVLTGLVFSLLVLAKQAYLYLAYCLVLAGLFIIMRSIVGRGSAIQPKPVTYFLLPILIIVGGHTAYNRLTINQQTITSARAEGVLMLRAEYGTMTWREYALSFVYHTPVLGNKLRKGLLSEQDFLRLDLDEETSFRAKHARRDSVVRIKMRELYGVDFSPYEADLDPGRVSMIRHAALISFWSNLPFQLTLTPVFVYRGLVGAVGSNLVCDWRKPSSVVFCGASFIGLGVGILAFCILIVVYASKTDIAKLVFFFPAVYYVLFYGLFTHFLPRYGLLVAPYLAIAFALFVHLLLRARFWRR